MAAMLPVLLVLLPLALLPSPARVAVAGTVLGRHALGKKLVFVDLETPDGMRQLLLKRARAEDRSEPYLRHPLDRMIYDLGATIRVVGHQRPDKKLGHELLVAHEATLLTAAPSEYGVRHVLEAMMKGVVNAEAASAALGSAAASDVELLLQAPAAAPTDAVLRVAAALQGAATDQARRAATGVKMPLPAADDADQLKTLAAAAVSVAAAGGGATAHQLLATEAPCDIASALDSRGEESGKWVCVEGEVGARRRLQGGMVLLSLRDGAERGEAPRAAASGGGGPVLQCVLDPSLCAASGRRGMDMATMQLYAALAAPGARVRLAATWSAETSGGPRLIVLGARLIRCSSVQKVVRHCVASVASGALPAAEGAAAMQWSEVGEDGDAAAALVSQLRGASAAEMRWLAMEVSARLQSAHPAPQHGVTALSEAACAALATHSPLRSRFPLRRLPPSFGAEVERRGADVADPAPETGSAAADAPAGVEARAPQSPRRAMPRPPLPRGALAHGRDGSWWSAKKRPQLRMMAALIGELLCAHPEWRQRPLHVVDVGGGHGHLAQHVAEVFGQDVRVTLVDIAASKLTAASARANRRAAVLSGGLYNLRFLPGDAAELAERGEMGRVDVVTGLHACGGLSDLIVAHAVSQGAAFAVCTCCFRSNRDMRVPAAPEGSLHEPGAMYVPRDTWLGLPAAELHALLRAAELQGRPDAAREAVHTVNAVRALAAERDWAARWERSCQDAGAVPPRLLVRLVEFDPKFSPRSCVVLGEPQW